jgi:hypothetical protein
MLVQVIQTSRLLTLVICRGLCIEVTDEGRRSEGGIRSNVDDHPLLM